jgi:hypothetical protein
VLYGGRRFRCRRCVAVPYASQNEAVHDRLLRRAQAVRERLGGGEYASLGMPFPAKPKRMRWTTYRRLREVSERCRRCSLLAAARRFDLLRDELDDMNLDSRPSALPLPLPCQSIRDLSLRVPPMVAVCCSPGGR